jgi:FAD:protein FMN transferase
MGTNGLPAPFWKVQTGAMEPPKPTSRREFLQGRSAGRLLWEKVRAWADATSAGFSQLTTGTTAAGSTALPPPQLGSGRARLSVSRRAMACEFSIEFPADRKGSSSEAALAALDRVEEIESQLSVYRDTSEVARLNASAAHSPQPCTANLCALLELAAEIFEATGGAFDITTGPLSRVWGFFQREGRFPDPEELETARSMVGQQRVLVDTQQQSVFFAAEGTEIHFNSLGKGYALDEAALLLEDQGLADFLIQGGSSSVLARGIQPGGTRAGWRVGIPHPHTGERLLGEICLRNQALGTSGSGTQFFEHDGQHYGHLIDPRTGWPTQGVLTATAIAATAAEADALATAFYILGPGGTSEYCAAHPSHGALLVCPGSGASPLDIHCFNLPADLWFPA